MIRSWKSKLVVLFVVSSMSLLIGASPVFAFKVDTHVWVGQQIINDLLPDGKVTIPIDSVPYDFTVDPTITQAIINNPDVYRMGNIGPDAFPDIITGQSVVHPGHPNGWKTDDWLKWLTTNAATAQDRAFAYGYLSHAAADVFAHTYVNQYAGDTFDIFDNELDVEARHIVLEQYISSRTPPLTDHAGNPLGDAYNVVSAPSAFIRDNLIFNDTVADQYRLTSTSHLASVHSLRADLIDLLSEDGLLRQLEIKITAAMMEKFLGVVYVPDEVAEVVWDISENVYNDYNTMALTNQGLELLGDVQTEFFNDLIHVANTQGREAAEQYHTAMIDLLTLKGKVFTSAEKLADAVQKTSDIPQMLKLEVIDFVERSLCSDSQGTFAILKEPSQQTLQDHLRIIITPDHFPIIWYQGNQGATPSGENIPKIFINDEVLANNIDPDLVERLVDLSLPSDDFGNELALGASLVVPGAYIGGGGGAATAWAAENSSWLQGGSLAALFLYKEGIGLAEQTLSETIEIIDSNTFCVMYPTFCAANKISLDLACGAVEMLQEVVRIEPYLNPAYIANQSTIATLELLIPETQALADDAEAAVKQFSNESVNLAIDTMEFTRDSVNIAIAVIDRALFDQLDPLREYLEDWVTDIDNGMMNYVTVNGEVIKETLKPNGDPMAPIINWLECDAFSIVGIPDPVLDAACFLEDRSQQLLDSLDGILGYVDALNPIAYLVDEIKSRVLNEIRQEVEELTVAFIEKKAGIDIESIVDILQQGEDQLDFVYTTGLGGAQKSLLPIPDISQRVESEMMTSNGYFDKNAYAVIYNAVIMSKLSLLSGDQLNQLALAAGVTDTGIYGDGAPLFSNIGSENVLFNSIKSIDGNHQWMHVAPPYPRQSTGPDLSTSDMRSYGYIFNGINGFRLWQNPTARELVFKKIFKGPLSPGIDAPEMLGFSEILPLDYPYSVCANNPFPLSVHDRTCDDGNIDEDDLDDVWEMINIGNLLQAGEDNPDGDNKTNSQEQAAGTNPLLID